MNKSSILAIIAILLYANPLFAAMTDSDWDSVNAQLIAKRNAAGTDAALNTQCSAAGICLETSKWLFVNNLDQTYRENLITKADSILNMPTFEFAPWAVYFSDIGVSIMATESMAYLFRYSGTNHVFLDSIYYYDATLGGSLSDHTERQRLFLRPTGNTSGYLWAVECRKADGSGTQTRYSNNAAGMSAPQIGGVNGQNAWMKFTWNSVSIPNTTRVVKVEVKVEVYSGQPAISGISKADSSHGAWWIDVQHVSGSTHNLWAVEFPNLNRIEKFHRFAEDAYILMPKNGGTLFKAGQLENTNFFETSYPGSEIPYQLVLATQKNAGMMYYCDDKDGFHKMLRAADADTATRLSWVHYPKMQGGTAATVKLTDTNDLNYACRIGVYTGDWYDAAVWYREHWLSNLWADFLPDTMRGGWLLDAHHGTYTWGTLKSEYDSWLKNALNTHFPGTAWAGSHSAYAWRQDFKPESLKYPGQWIYEPLVQVVSQAGRAYSYEPIQSNHYSQIATLRSSHNERVLLYTAGRLMCKLFYNFGNYPDSPHYTNPGETWAVKTAAGSQPYIPRRDSNNNLIGNRGYVCPANLGWRTFLAEQVEQMMLRASSANQYPGGVYLDVTCSRPTYGGPCYNLAAGHGHPDECGGGKHYAQGTNAMLDLVREYGRRNGNTDFVVVTEGHGDIFLKHIDSYIYFQNDEDEETVDTSSFVSIPFSPVLWADKIRPYADKSAGEAWDGVSRTPLKTARAFVNGVGMGRIKQEAFSNTRQITALKRMVNYRRNFAPFLARGKMCRPPVTNYDNNTSVVCATWKSGDDYLFAFANGSDSAKSVTAQFNLKALGVGNPLAYKLYTVEENGSYQSELLAKSFPASGLLTETFTLQALGVTTSNKGIFCYVAKSLCSPTQPDINNDTKVNLTDFTAIAAYWLRPDCGHLNNCCQGADLYSDGTINEEDLFELIDFWLNN